MKGNTQSYLPLGMKRIQQIMVIVLLSAFTGWSVASPLTIYDQPNLAGTGVSVPNTYTVYSGQSGIPGGLNNSISSFQLDQGYLAIVADPNDGLHPSKTYIASDGPLTVNTLPAELDNSISYIRVVPFKNPVKKGKCGWANDPSLATGWYYQWNGILEWGQSTNDIRGYYVPMCFGYGATQDIQKYLDMNEVDTLIAFNEPDDPDGQSGQYYGMSNVTNAVSYYEVLQTAGLRLGSPSGREDTANNENSWMSQFIQMSDAAGYRMDFACLHWYDRGSSKGPNDNPDLIMRRFKKYLSHAYHMYRRPLWITEFNAHPNRVTSVQDAFLQQALPWLEKIGYVERYAYYQPNSGTGNFVDTNGVITSTGLIYSNHVSTVSYIPTDLPDGLTRVDIGSPSQTGIALHRNGTFTVGGNGNGVGGTSDQCSFVYEQVSGDCEIIAQVYDVIYRSSSDQGGIMIRETLNAGSKQASMMMLPESKGSKFIYRPTENGSSTTVSDTSISAPYWVKLNRTGDLLSAYTSPDGSTWTLQGSQSINMTADVYIGLFAACPVSTWESDSIFTDVTVSAAQNQPPAFTAHSINKPDAIEGAAYSETIYGSATDPDLDLLEYSLIVGPSWLNIASGGMLSGTPGGLDAGITNSWSVQVSDGNGGLDSATLHIFVQADGGPVTLVGGSKLNGNFNANPGTSVSFSNTDYWYNLAGAQSTECTRDNLTNDGSQNAVLAGSRQYAQDLGYTIAQGDVFDVSYIWRDALNWDDATNQVAVSLFVTDDDTLTGVRTDLVTDYSGLSTIDSSYETVDHKGIYTANAADAGKALFFVIGSIESNGFGRLDDVNLTVTAATNLPPVWNSLPGPWDATEGVAFNKFNDWRVSDPDGDDITWAKVSGPAWMNVNTASGKVNGTPGTGDVGTNSITISITDTYNAPVEATAQVIVTAAAVPATHVGSIVPSVVNAGGPNKYGVVTVTIVDAADQPVSGATVSGTFTGSYSESGSAVTDGSGVVVIQTAAKKKNPSFTFTVNNVTASGYIYDPGSNIETSDSY